MTGRPTLTAPACAVTGAYKGALTCTNNPASVGPGVGSGSVTPTVSGGTLTNFTITAVNGAWSITKATSTVTLTCPASVVYNGAAQTPCTASVTGAGGLSQSITPTYANNTNAGTATATATYAGDANHAAATRTANFTINPAPVTATAGGYTGTYDGTAHATAPACAVTGTFTGSLTCTNNPASVGPAVGSGTVTPTVTGGTLTNFAITSVNGAWSITKATSTVTCDLSGERRLQRRGADTLHGDGDGRWWIEPVADGDLLQQHQRGHGHGQCQLRGRCKLCGGQQHGELHHQPCDRNGDSGQLQRRL